MPQFGWCPRCPDRVGVRKFRELVYGVACQECAKHFKLDIIPTEPQTPKRKSNYKPVTEHKRRGPKPKVKTVSPKIEARRNSDTILLTAFSLMSPDKFIDSWCDNMAAYLGWTKHEVKVVAKRLRRLGHQAPPYNTDTLILMATDKFKGKPFRALDVQVADLCPSYIRIRLDALVKRGHFTYVRHDGQNKFKTANLYKRI